MPEPRGQVRLRAVGSSRGFDLNGPTACEVLTVASRKRILERLGPDPLRDDADFSIVRDRLRRSRAEIGRLLLDQSVLAGVGNVYRAEALHIENMHPERQARSISDAELDSLWSTIVRLLKIGVKYNRIITTDPSQVGRPFSRMRRHERLHVYGRQQCGSCGGAVCNWNQGARTIYACLRCQPK